MSSTPKNSGKIETMSMRMSGRRGQSMRRRIVGSRPRVGLSSGSSSKSPRAVSRRPARLRRRPRHDRRDEGHERLARRCSTRADPGPAGDRPERRCPPRRRRARPRDRRAGGRTRHRLRRFSSSILSTQRIALTSDSAAVRSATPSKKPTGWLLYQRSSRQRQGLAVPRRCLGDLQSERGTRSETPLGVSV